MVKNVFIILLTSIILKTFILPVSSIILKNSRIIEITRKTTTATDLTSEGGEETEVPEPEESKDSKEIKEKESGDDFFTSSLFSDYFQEIEMQAHSETYKFGHSNISQKASTPPPELFPA